MRFRHAVCFTISKRCGRAGGAGDTKGKRHGSVGARLTTCLNARPNIRQKWRRYREVARCEKPTGIIGEIADLAFPAISGRGCAVLFWDSSSACEPYILSGPAIFLTTQGLG